MSLKLHRTLWPKLGQAPGLCALYRALPVLSRMERNGVRIDAETLRAQGRDLGARRCSRPRPMGSPGRPSTSIRPSRSRPSSTRSSSSRSGAHAYRATLDGRVGAPGASRRRLEERNVPWSVMQTLRNVRPKESTALRAGLPEVKHRGVVALPGLARGQATIICVRRTGNRGLSHGLSRF